MTNENGSPNEEIKIKLARRDILLLLLCINITHNHTKGGTLLYDLDCLREKLVAESDLTMYSAR
jgi:hypothetical protein